MNSNTAKIASLLGEPSRAAILMSLMDGRFHTAGELAFMAAVTPQTASFHLSKLENGRLVVVENHGRHRYYRLAGEEVAHLLEIFLAVSPPVEVRSLKQASQLNALRRARTCYDHLAGNLGIELTESMVTLGCLEKEGSDFAVTPQGEQVFSDLGLDLSLLRKKRRSFSRACLDWSERRHHLGGALGFGLASRFFELGWISRVPSTRAVKVTNIGKNGFKKHFHLDF